MVTNENIQKAYERIKKHLIKTPLLESHLLNEYTHAKILVKAECLQHTGSFKYRGALNMISKINDHKKVVAPSSGNHAQGVAAAAYLLKKTATLVMPSDAPKVKISGVRSFGGNIVFYDRQKEDRFKIAKEIAKKENAILIPPYDHQDIICGQGTIGIESIEQMNEKNFLPDIVLCCCGGGGLISGIATSLKATWPKVNIHSVEPYGWDDTNRSLIKGSRVQVSDKIPSLCDALLAETPGKLTFEINRKLLSHGLIVNDQQVLAAIQKAFLWLKIVVEPGGSVALSAALNESALIKNKNVLVIVSGGNIDTETFKKALNNK